jgi:hypothetical protein
MTIEQSTAVGPEDIGSVVFACRICATEVTLRLENIRQPLIACANCGAQWLSSNTSEHQLISRILHDLPALEAALRNRQFSLRFQLRRSEHHQPVENA